MICSAVFRRAAPRYARLHLFSRVFAGAIAALALVVAPSFAQTTGAADALSPSQRDALENIFAVFPDSESLQTLRERISAVIRRRAIAELHEDDSLPAFGEEDGARVVEFSDYRCGFCRRMFPLLQAENARIKVVEFPVLGEMSVLAARYALAAREQNGYAAFHVALMNRGGQLDETALAEAAKEAGLDFERLRQDAEDAKIDAALRKNRRYAASLGVRGTPFMVIGDNTAPGAINADRLKTMLRAAENQ